MSRLALRDVMHVAIGVAIAAAVLQTWLVLGWIVPVMVSGSSMAPALLGPHRTYRCLECSREFAVGLDQLPLGANGVCPSCGRRSATPTKSLDERGERLVVDRTAFEWRAPRRWEMVVFRCPEDARDWCVKRVVGLPGETIALAGGDVFINGRIVRKTLPEQRSLRQAVDLTGEEMELRTTKLDDIVCHTSARWLPNDSGRIEYHHPDSRPITDEMSYNQGAVPPPNRVYDIMLTFEARFAGAGQMVLMAANEGGCSEAIVDFGRREIRLRRNDRTIAHRPLPGAEVGNSRFAEWTFSLFDCQALLAIGDDVVLAEPLERDDVPGGEPSPPLTIEVRGLAGEIRRVAVWRDAYYAVRYGDGRQPGAERGAMVTWRLGPAEFFVLGDNAAISDDSRSWPSGPGLDAKLLIGKPLGVR